MRDHGQTLRRRSVMAAVLAMIGTMAVALGGAGPAVAAGPPTATTLGTSDVTATTAVLNGTFFGNGNDTTYRFEYGTTTAYGTQTPVEGPFRGNSTRDVAATVTGLKPSTTYHFRIVATNSAGTAFGENNTFTTPAGGAPGNQNAVTITATPALLTFGRATTISGQVTGPDNADVQVTLEENPYPYTAGFRPTAGKTNTNAAGAYSFPVSPTANVRYRVTAKTKPFATSPEVTVTVRLRVGLRLSDRTPKVGQRVRFSGTVSPAHDGTVARIQRRTAGGSWRTIARATLRAAAPVNGVTRSTYAKRLRIRRNGTYRVRVSPGDGDHARGTSARRSVRVH